ncbi:hypothetical protein AAE478_007430 [Parahypoxylon ruwenzoriense]
MREVARKYKKIANIASPQGPDRKPDACENRKGAPAATYTTQLSVPAPPGITATSAMLPAPKQASAREFSRGTWATHHSISQRSAVCSVAGAMLFDDGAARANYRIRDARGPPSE